MIAEPPEKIDRRRKTATPLTPEQRELVAAQNDPGNPWVPKWVRCCLPRGLIRRLGIEECVAEAWVLVVRAASLWADDGRATFRTFAMSAIQRFLLPRLNARLAHENVWVTMPKFDGNRGAEEDQHLCSLLADHRTDGRDPLLRLWCSPVYRRLRKLIDWRGRVVLYLRYVECWTLEEVGAALGVERQRVHHLERRARERLEQAYPLAVQRGPA